MPGDVTFQELLARLRSGDDQAASQIFQKFVGLLLGKARTRLDQRLRRKTEPEDVVLSAFKSFFLGFREGRLQVNSWDSVEGLLVVITLRKCCREIKRFHGPFRDVRKEVANPAGAGDSAVVWEAIAREPTPAEAAELAETLALLMSSLDARDQRILELRLEGNKAVEIADLVGLTEFTVQGVLKKIQKRLKKMREEHANAE